VGITGNRESISNALASNEKRNMSAERLKEFTEFAIQLEKHLSREELQQFQEDPFEFTSQTLLFRGIDNSKYNHLLQSGEYSVQSGEMGEEAVYFTNRPYTAFICQQKGVLAVINKEKLVLRNPSAGLFQVGSAKYKKEANRLRAKGISVWEINNHMDTISNIRGTSKAERYTNMKLAQPIGVTKAFLVWKDGKVVVEQPPKGPPKQSRTHSRKAA
jgi:hypothetical protein